jgi:membrane fusion protein (multidrug efflux system)
MKRRKRRWTGWLALGVVLLAVTTVVIVIARLAVRNNDEWREHYQTAHVESIVFNETVEITGNLRPVESRDLTFPVSGRVIEVPVEVGSEVARGSVVARLDDRRARFDLATVEKTLQQKRLTGSTREIEILELEREITAQAVQDHVLRSPIAGRVSEIDLSVGDQAAAGRRAVRVIDDSSFRANVQIDEIDSPKVCVNQPVRFFFDALPELEVAGEVLSLAIEGRTTSQGLAVRDGQVLIENPPDELLSGYSFTGQILLGEEETVLAIPEEALFNQRGETFVLLPPDKGTVPRRNTVEARILDEDRIRIVSGLTAGQTILLPLAAGLQRDKLSTEGLLDSLKQRSRIPLVRED